jgi:hypothetical protein
LSTTHQVSYTVLSQTENGNDWDFVAHSHSLELAWRLADAFKECRKITSKVVSREDYEAGKLCISKRPLVLVNDSVALVRETESGLRAMADYKPKTTSITYANVIKGAKKFDDMAEVVDILSDIVSKARVGRCSEWGWYLEPWHEGMGMTCIERLEAPHDEVDEPEKDSDAVDI